MPSPVALAICMSLISGDLFLRRFNVDFRKSVCSKAVPPVQIWEKANTTPFANQENKERIAGKI